MTDIDWKDLRPQIKDELTSDLTHGNHFSVIAPTGGGKTTLVTKGLIPMFNNIADVLLIDSTADPKLSSYGQPLRKWGKISGVRRLTVGDLTDFSVVKVRNALEKAFKQGEMVIVFDEVRHITDSKYLGLSASAEYLWLFSRKRKNLVGGLTQAPRYVPSAFYDQSKLHFIFKIRDRRAMLRLAEIGGDYDAIKAVAPTLGKYEFAFVNTDGDVITSKFDLNMAQEPMTNRNKSKASLIPAEQRRRIVVTRK